ncbi:unnamed protein product [Colias eurytheme]|nr:unnamed protein product [Colias eurytheme]
MKDYNNLQNVVAKVNEASDYYQINFSVEEVRSKKGKTNLKIGNCTYYKRPLKEGKARWCCTINKYCKATVYTSRDQTYFSVEEVRSKRGKTNLKIGNCTYYKRPQKIEGKARWSCTTNKYCKAAVYTSRGVVVAINDCHNHDVSK